MNKIIFIDLDGTLCNSNSEITKETLEAIHKVQQAGNIIVISTGRRLNRIIPLIEKCKIYSYIIALNGAQIYDCNTGKMLLEEKIDFTTSNQIYQLSKKYPNVKISFHTGLLRYNNDPYPDDILLNDDSFKELEYKNISQIVFYSELVSLIDLKIELEKSSNIRIVNQSRDLIYKDNSYFKNDSFIDIGTIDVSKGKAIEFLLNYLNITKDNAIAIGDGINDLSMFEAVGTRVAMENADAFLKEKADYITLSNDENGVAYYLEKLIK